MVVRFKLRSIPHCPIVNCCFGSENAEIEREYHGNGDQDTNTLLHNFGYVVHYVMLCQKSQYLAVRRRSNQTEELSHSHINYYHRVVVSRLFEFISEIN